MDEEQLKTFLAVAKAGSFSSAENETFISKQAMIKQINKLEEEIGVSLMKRHRTGVVLTDAGKCFAKGAEHLLEEEHSLLQECRKMDHRAIVRIGNVEHQTLLDPVNQAFAEKYPDIELQKVVHPNHSGEWRVENHIQDVAETFVSDRGQLPSYSFTRLLICPYYAVMDPSHPLAEKKQIQLTDLLPYQTMIYPIMMMSSYVIRMQKVFAVHTERLEMREDVDHQVEAAFSLKETNHVLIGANPFLNHISDLKKIQLAEDWKREYGIIYMTPVSDTVQKYIDTAVSVYSVRK